MAAAAFEGEIEDSCCGVDSADTHVIGDCGVVILVGDAIVLLSATIMTKSAGSSELVVAIEAERAPPCLFKFS